MTRTITEGSTDQRIRCRLLDSDGLPATGIAHNAAGLAIKYQAVGASASTVTLSAGSGLNATHDDGGWNEIGNGWYQIDMPDDAFATGNDSVLFFGASTANSIIFETVQVTAPDDVNWGIYPEAWQGIRDIQIGYNVATGRFYTSVDSLESWRAAYMLDLGQIYYVDVNEGNDSNNGLTKATAFKTIGAAIATGDYDTVYVQGGIYSRGNGFTSAPSRSSNWIATGGDVICGCLESAKTMAQSGSVYSVAATNILNVVSANESDWDVNAVPVPYTQRATVGELVANGDWHYDDTTLSIFWDAGSQPVWNVDIFVIRAQIDNTLINSAGVSVYAEGLHFLGGVELTGASGDASKFYGFNCKATNKVGVGYSGNWRVRAIADFRLNQGISAYSGNDGYNFHNEDGFTTSPDALLINSDAYESGYLQSSGSNQGFTLHEDYRGLTVNGSLQVTTQDASLHVGSSSSLMLGPTITGTGGSTSLNFDSSGLHFVVRPKLESTVIQSVRNNQGTAYYLGLASGVSRETTGTGAWIELTANDLLDRDGETLNQLDSRATEARWAKLDVTGTLANTDNADTFKATSVGGGDATLANQTTLLQLLRSGAVSNAPVVSSDLLKLVHHDRYDSDTVRLEWITEGKDYSSGFDIQIIFTDPDDSSIVFLRTSGGAEPGLVFVEMTADFDLDLEFLGCPLVADIRFDVVAKEDSGNSEETRIAGGSALIYERGEFVIT